MKVAVIGAGFDQEMTAGEAARSRSRSSQSEKCAASKSCKLCLSVSRPDQEIRLGG